MSTHQRQQQVVDRCAFCGAMILDTTNVAVGRTKDLEPCLACAICEERELQKQGEATNA